MFTLKYIVVIFIVHNTGSTFHFPGNRDKGNWMVLPVPPKTVVAERMEHSESKYPNGHLGRHANECLENDQSLISYSDLKYLIDEKAEKLQIKEHFVNKYYPEAKELFENYSDELKDFRKQFEDRPNHILHILNDTAKMRQELEPLVDKIAVRLHDFYNIDYSYYDMKERSDAILNQLVKYKNMCKINCDEDGIETRFGHKITHKAFNISTSAVNNNRYCVKLKDLNDIIDAKLSQLHMKYDEEFHRELQIRDKLYAQKISELQINLKEAAVKQFGTTMYQILSLQDNYHHFTKDLKNFNISTEELDNIEENTAEIKLRLIGLKRDVEKYRQYCMKCSNRRVKRNIINLLDSGENLQETQIENNADINILDKLIGAKIDEIKGMIKSNLTDMFKDLDKDFNDPDVVDLCIKKLQPIQHQIDNDIEMEQKALNELSNRIPKESIEKILALSKESKQIIQSLETAKQFIDRNVYF